MNPHVRRALALFEQQRFGEAEGEILQLLGVNPADSAAHALMGLCVYLQGRRAEAVTHARESLGLSRGTSGYESVTRALLDRSASLQNRGVSVGTLQSPGRFAQPRSASSMRAAFAPALGVESSSVDFLAPTAEIESFLERWYHLLEASLPSLGRSNVRYRGVSNPRQSVRNAAVARKPLARSNRIRLTGRNPSAQRRGHKLSRRGGSFPARPR